ncbi:MptD family putative ECF transporter S component [Butyrivibrio sp. ob235]|uniref:MptD family putative ECF transporter S component n=1 Tax=Butyrivibrio sp. ob235 TaxID=1761780 RepID=UPI000B83E714|nr:MptD family putative ECF transporter S component [Butyrivibrio sp. ob235]
MNGGKSFYAYSAHWWTDTAGSLQAAVEEMPEGYADMMEPVIANTPGLIIALVFVIPVAILGMIIAEKVMKKQADSLK